MLTRLKVSGFKNLVDVELRFGPLTCMAGPNGVGKSNVFDALRFLALLADRTFVEAAAEVRGGADIADLFTSGGNGEMTFACDILIGAEGTDDFGQPARASYTFLCYELTLRLERDGAHGLPRIRLERERLDYITKTDSSARLGFHPSKGWLDSVLLSSSRRKAFISTEEQPGTAGGATVRLHADKMGSDPEARRGGGKPSDFNAARLPRTVLSSAQNADENRTAVLLRQEFRRWQVLQLEPSALRRPDNFQDPARIDAQGAHVPATLHRLGQAAMAGLGQAAGPESSDAVAAREAVYAGVANRLAQLMDDVRAVRVDRDEARRVLRFMLRDPRGNEFPATSLSDGTLRFVALAVLASDPEATGVLCLEEPENGIHPSRVDAIVQLLADMAVDPSEPVDADNPLRQMMVSTHSPVVAAKISRDHLVFARPRRHGMPDGRVVAGLEFAAMNGAWRTAAGTPAVALGMVQNYLQAANGPPPEGGPAGPRVIDVVSQQLERAGLPAAPAHTQLPLVFGEPRRSAACRHSPPSTRICEAP